MPETTGPLEALNLIEHFSKFVKTQREKQGLSQKALSEKAFDYHDHSYISALENGRLDGMSVQRMEKLLSALQCTVFFTENRHKDENTIDH